jgi:acyl-homoserine lactone acylase PvdQ
MGFCSKLCWVTAITLPVALFIGYSKVSQDIFGGQTEFDLQAKTPSSGRVLKAEIFTDQYGLKYVEGESYQDVVFGQGFA